MSIDLKLSAEEMEKAQVEAKAIHLNNLESHLKTIQREMEMINIKLLSSPSLKAQTIVHEMKGYQDLTLSARFIIEVGNWAYPEVQPAEQPAETDSKPKIEAV